MTRQDFESLSSREQRKVAEKEYSAMSALIFAECREQGNFSDGYGALSEIHHAWPRSKAPLWYKFQRENMFPISQRLHYTIHFKAPSDMTPKEKEYYDYFREVKDRLKRENDEYQNSK